VATTAIDDLHLILTTMAVTIVDNTIYFSELDQVVGDGDFGYSLRSGFEVVQSDLDTFDHGTVGALLKKVGFVISSKVGGSSGPIWGTAFLRAAKEAGDRTELTSADVIAILRAAITGIMDRGGASLGEKTLLDSLVPAVDALEAALASPSASEDHGAAALQAAADAATAAAEATKPMLAMRGRAAYTGERSIGSVDAGATAVGVILQSISGAWRETHA
jgi:phosphoenolpyruvate---glycerone phosphotransferase subunit DhaL